MCPVCIEKDVVAVTKLSDATQSFTEEGFIADEESRIRDYFSLLKPRVMTLVVFTGIAGMYMAPGEIHPFIALVATFCIALGSGASGAVNMWYERETDALMDRTKQRPLPAGRLNPASAIEFAVILALASVVIMAVAVNLMAAIILAIAILFYIFIYTIWLKRRTPQNIVIGGAAGAFPPMIGWAAVTGDISIESTLLFLIIFVWTPPHFWALALYKCKDYANAGIPMLPVVAGEAATRKQILLYSVLLVSLSLFPLSLNMAGALYGSAALLLGGRFLMLAYMLYREYQESTARHLFKYSILYLFALFVLLMVDKL
jgi:protoheme IX farnesyltransferase